MRVQICGRNPCHKLMGQKYAPEYRTKVTIVGHSFFRELGTIPEGCEGPEDTQTSASPSALVPTPYFTPPSPPWVVDPESPPENPTVFELAYMISRRIPPRFARAHPSAPKVSSVTAFPAFLDHDLTSGQAWGNMLKLEMFAEGRRAYNTGAGLGIDVAGLEAKELFMSFCPQAERL